jgi:hypothetical protein
MRYTLVTARGKVMTFFLKELAEVYRVFEGGVLTKTA